MYGAVKDQLAATLTEIEEAGLYKRERELTTPQSSHVATGRRCGAELLRQQLPRASPTTPTSWPRAGRRWTSGASGWRRCASSAAPRPSTPPLESRLSEFLGTEATILYSSCFDANGGVFEVLFGAEDAIVSDELNHASIIDGIRLSKAARFRYRNADMADLRAQLEAARAGGARRVCVVTDGVFSMDGSYAPLDEICDLADEFEAMVLVDDSHAVGFVGEGGRGTPELFGVMDRVDIITGTLGKALGGASGGYVASHQRGRRPAAPALAPLPVLQLGRPGRRRGLARGARPGVRVERGAGDVARQRRPLPRADDGCRVRAAARVAPDHPGDVPG